MNIQNLDIMKKFSIYQLKDEAPNARYIKFTSYKDLKASNITLSLDIYDKIFDGETETEKGNDDYDTLETLYMRFQGRKPEGYKGHSLSTSDIVELDGRFYYVDFYGYKEIKF